MKNICKNITVLVISLIILGCQLFEEKKEQVKEFSVHYQTSGYTGLAPVDSRRYISGDKAVILDNTGNLVMDGYDFIGWRKDFGGTGKLYIPKDKIVIDQDVFLYPQFSLNKYTITYDINGADSGTAPTDDKIHNISSAFIVLGNTGEMVKVGYKFAGWSTRSYGSGYVYNVGAEYFVSSTLR